MLNSYKIRETIIDITGYWIYKKKDLPVGVDLKEDLSNKFNISPKCIFDVGANYGQSALYYYYKFKDCTIYSFEPVKRSFDILVNNTKHFKRIICVNYALGEKKQELLISLYDENNSQLNSLIPKNSSNYKNSVKELVKVITLNDFVQENKINSIDLLKIDTEGFEIPVLRGGSYLLVNKIVKAILCEVALSKRNKRNTQLEDIIYYLDTYDYLFVGLYDSNIKDFRDGIAFSNALFIRK